MTSVSSETMTTMPISRTQPLITAFTPAHIPGAWALSQQAKWPHRPEDWALNQSVSQGLVAIDQDRVVGTALATPMGEVATINMIIVDPSMRGRGLGRALLEAAMAAAAGREMRLVATTDGLPLYQKLGFVTTGRIVQHQGIARPEKIATSERAELAQVPVTASDDLDAALAMDAAASGLSRGALLSGLCQTGTLLRAEGGFALIRHFGRGELVGPIVARDRPVARALIAAAADRCAGRFLRVDLVAEHGLSDFVESLGLACIGEGTCMSCNPRALLPASPFTTFALLSQALG
jgi:ribosomal protein S18 acetylase RimI-like enzyme